MAAAELGMSGSRGMGFINEIRSHLAYAEAKVGQRNLQAGVQFGASLATFAVAGWVGGRSGNYAIGGVVPWELPVGAIFAGVAVACLLTEKMPTVESAATGIATVLVGAPVYKLFTGWGVASRRSALGAGTPATSTAPPPAATKGWGTPEIVGASYGGGALSAQQAFALSR